MFSSKLKNSLPVKFPMSAQDLGSPHVVSLAGLPQWLATILTHQQSLPAAPEY